MDAVRHGGSMPLWPDHIGLMRTSGKIPKETAPTVQQLSTSLVVQLRQVSGAPLGEGTASLLNWA